MIPKWKIEKKFMLRMAKRKGRLPDQEHLIAGDSDACLEYAKILQTRLPEHLENFLVDNLAQKDSREVLDWIIEYTKISGGKTSPKLDNLFLERSIKNSKSPYDFGGRRILNYCKACNGDISPKLEELIWSSEHCAYQYAVNYNKKIPKEYEKKVLEGVDDDDLLEYIKKFFKKLSPEIESLLVERPGVCYLYAKNVIKGKLPDSIHSALIMKTYIADGGYKDDVKEYLDFVDEVNLYVINVISNFDGETKVVDILKSLKNSP